MADLDPMSALHPITRAWFRSALGEPTEPQRRAWPVIAGGAHTLLMAPTGSGKTLAAFLALLDRLFRRLLENPGAAGGGVRVAYVSPLKALNNDIQVNLEAPLAGLRQAFASAGLTASGPTSAVRTGDTPSHQRQAMIRRPPEILITTPESLFLLLASPKAREILRTAEAVIVDEIHALAGSKRGSHLALSLERLEALAGRPLQRIGLSATLEPPQAIARFLAGDRPVEIIDAGAARPMELQVDLPVEDMRTLPEGGIWPAAADYVLKRVRERRSTLIFVNSRALAERFSAMLNEMAGEPLARAHHGSLSRQTREEVEAELKAGRLKALVATSSLELGIDIGAIDLVIQLESPREAARGLQRIGRAGHAVGAVSVGCILPKSRADLLEAAAVASSMAARQVEPVRIPEAPLDILAQHLVGMGATDVWRVDEAFSLVRRAGPYAALSRRAFEEVLDLLDQGVPHPAYGQTKPRLIWERASETFKAPSGARLLLYANAGAIPDRGYYPAFLEGGGRVGELDEEFIYESRVGDVFRLGSATWEIAEIGRDRVTVRPAPGRTPRLPFWKGDGLGRSYAAGLQVGGLLREAEEWIVRQGGDAAAGDLAAWLQSRAPLSQRAAINLAAYLLEGWQALEGLPHDRRLIVETFFDEVGDRRIIVHSPFGGRVHAGLALLLQDLIREEFSLKGEVVAGDDGLVFRLPGGAAATFSFLERIEPAGLGRRLLRELENMPLYGALFRQSAARALLLPRGRAGRRQPLWLQRLRGQDLLDAARSLPRFPLLEEAAREALYDVFDFPALHAVAAGIDSGRIEIALRERHAPSPFAAQLLFAQVDAFMYEDDTPRAERASRLLELDPQTLRELLGEGGLAELLDPDRIAALEDRLSGASARLDSRAQLERWIRLTGDRTEAEIAQRAEGPWRTWLKELAPAIRPVGGLHFTSERAALYEEARGGGDAGDAALDRLLEGFLQRRGPVTAAEAAGRYQLPPWRVEEAFHRLRERGAAEHGLFRRPQNPGQATPAWVHPAVLQQIHRESLAQARRAVEPVEPAAYQRFLLAWQGVVGPDGRKKNFMSERPDGVQGARGAQGAREIEEALVPLQGVALPLSVWEGSVLPNRLPGYRPGDIDRFTESGAGCWRIHRQTEDGPPWIAFYHRADYPLLAPPPADPAGPAAKALELLRERGASFADEVAQAAGFSAGGAHEALMQLAAAGRAAQDGLSVLRTPPQRTAGPGEARTLRESGRLTRARRAAARSARIRWGRSPNLGGRWFLLPEVSSEVSQRAQAAAEVLLDRLGIVTQEAFKEAGWSELWPAAKAWLHEAELRGQVRRGYFIQGAAGLQYGLPEAISQLQSLPPSRKDEGPILLSSLDPALYTGIPGLPPGFRRAPGTHLVIQGGRALLIAERHGRNLIPLWSTEEAKDEASLWTAALTPLPQLLDALRATGGPRRLLVDRVGGKEARFSPAGKLLEELGFVPEGTGMALYPPIR